MFSEAPAHLAILNREQSKHQETSSKSATSSPVHRAGKFAQIKSSSLTVGGNRSINAGDQAFVCLNSESVNYRAESFDRRDDSSVLSELIKSMVECPDYLVPSFKFKHGVSGLNELGVPATIKNPLRKQAAMNVSCDGGSVNCYTDDFILLSEFSEIEGPRPLCTWPTDGATAFNKNEYALHLMCVDFNAHLNQNQQRQTPSPNETADTGLNSSMSSSDQQPRPPSSGSSSNPSTTKFQLTRDTSIINYWDTTTQIAACVHHFTLYDLEARGFVRPFCLAYISYDRLKPVEFFEQIRVKFHEITDLFKISNYNAFKHDLEQRCLDLRLTRQLFLKWSELYQTTLTNPHDPKVNSERLNLISLFYLDPKTCARLSASSMNESAKKLQIQAIDYQVKELEAIISYMKRELIKRNWLFVNRYPSEYEKNCKVDSLMTIDHTASQPGEPADKNDTNKKCSSAVDSKYNDGSQEASKLRSNTMSDDSKASLSYLKERQKFFKSKRQPYSLRFQRPNVFKNILIGNSNLLVTANHGPDDSFALSIDFHNLNKTSGPTQKKMKPLRELSYETIENAYEEIDAMYNYFSMPYYILKYRQLTLKSATSSHMFDRFKMVKYLTSTASQADSDRKAKLSDLEKVKSKFSRNFNLFWSITMGDCVIADFSLFIDEYNLNKYQLIKNANANSSSIAKKNGLSTSHTIVETDVSDEPNIDGDDHQEARSRRMLKSINRLASSSLEPRSRKTNLSNIKVFVSQAEDLEVLAPQVPGGGDDDHSKTQWYIDMEQSAKSRSSSTLTRKLSRKLLRNTAIDDTNPGFQDQSSVDQQSNSAESKANDQSSANMSKTLFYSPVNNVLSSTLMMENQQKTKKRDNESTANRTNEMYSSVCESEGLRTTLVISKPEELDLNDDDDDDRDSLNGELRERRMENEHMEYATPKSMKNFEQLEQFLDFDDNDANVTVAEETGGGVVEKNSNNAKEPSIDFYNELVSNEVFTIKNYLETAICPNKDLESEKKFKFIYEEYETGSEGGASECVDGDKASQQHLAIGQVTIEIPKPPDSKETDHPVQKLSPAELKQLMFLKTQREENEYDFVNFLLDNENRKYASMAMDTDIKFLKRIRLAYDHSRRLNENFFHITVDDVEGKQRSLADEARAKTGELTLTDKLLKLSEYNFEETLKQLLNSSANLVPHLLYALLKGRPVVCVSRYCEGYEQLKMILNCLSNFIPNSFHALNNLANPGANSSSTPSPPSSTTSIPVYTGAPPFLTRTHELEASKNMNFSSEMTTPQLNAIFERKRIRLNDLKYCKLIGLSLCIVKDGNCCSAVCCSNNNKLINSNTSFRTSVGGYSDSMSSNKSDMFASLSTSSAFVDNSTTSSVMPDANKLTQSHRKNSAVHSMCHKHPHYHLNSKMTSQIIDDQLLNYIPITIRNYVSIFDLDKQTYLGPKYKGTLLNSFHRTSKMLQQDSISYLYLLDRIMQHYIKMAFIYNYSILFDSLNSLNLHQVTHQRSLDRSDSQARSQPKSINSSDKTKKRERLMNFYNVIIGNNNNSNQSATSGTSTGSTSNLNASAANRSRSGSLTQSIASYATAFLGSAAFSALTNPTTAPATNPSPAEQQAASNTNALSSKSRGQMTRAVSAQSPNIPSSHIEPISSLELLRVILSNIMTAQIPSLTPDQLASISANGSQSGSAEFDMCDVGIILNILRTLKVKQVYLYNLSMKRRKLKEDKIRLQDHMKRAASYSPPVPDFELEDGLRSSITKSFDDSSCNVPRIDVIVSSHDQAALNTPQPAENVSSSLSRPEDLSYYKQASLDHTQQLTTTRKEIEHHDQFQFPLTIEYEELVLFSAKK